MSPYNITRFVFATLLCVLLFQNAVWPILLIVFLIFISIVVTGAYFIQLNFFLRNVSRGNKNEKRVALTFDDGPVAGFTGKVLDILQEQQAEAAFFVIGNRIAGNEILIRRMHEEGHLIGNHSFSHNFWFDLKSASDMTGDLQLAVSTVEKIVGQKMRFFRPPYGVTNPNVAKAARNTNCISIGWSIRSMDTTEKNRERLFQRITKKLSNGDIILLHDWAEHTIGILPDLIKYIRAQGFEIVRLDKLINEKAYA